MKMRQDLTSVHVASGAHDLRKFLWMSEFSIRTVPLISILTLNHASVDRNRRNGANTTSTSKRLNMPLSARLFSQHLVGWASLPLSSIRDLHTYCQRREKSHTATSSVGSDAALVLPYSDLQSPVLGAPDPSPTTMIVPHRSLSV